MDVFLYHEADRTDRTSFRSVPTRMTNMITALSNVKISAPPALLFAGPDFANPSIQNVVRTLFIKSMTS